MIRAILMTTLLAGAPQAFAQALPPRDSLTLVFAETCMQHFYSTDQLRAALSAREVLPADQAEYFLGGKAGTAWIIVAPSTRYVVALREDGVCAAFAQQADAPATHSEFREAVSRAALPLVAKEIDAAKLGPNGKTERTIAFTWSRDGDPSELLFVLSTSEREEATAQAMASLSLVRAPERKAD